MAERRVDALTIEISADDGRVKATLAELQAYLKAIRDETVNIDIDVNAKDIQALRKTFKATEGDLIALERELKKSETTLDRRSKLFKNLHTVTKDFINDNWDAIKASKANKDGIQSLYIALSDVRNAYQATSSVAQDLTERQRIAAKGNEKAAKLAREEAKERAALIKEYEKEDAAHRKSIATQERANQLNEKYDLDLAKLIDRHAQLSDQMSKVSGKSAFLKTPQDVAKLERLRAEIEHTREAIRRLGGDMDALDGHSERSQNSLSRLVDQISRVRLHLGFFSLNVKQAAYALTAFGPVISGIVGAFSALIGVLGSGLVGALGLAGAAIGGFALSAAGIGFALKPLIKEFTTATDAATKYYEQVLKTGQGSSEAKDKLEDYKTVLKNLPPETRNAVVEFGKMKASWMKVSEELRKPFFNVMTDGMETLNSLMPMFQRNTVRAFGVASKGVKQWLSGLRGPEARTIMDTLMNRMISATPALMSGLGNIATALARLSQAASRALPGVMKNFNAWSKGIADSTATDGFALRMNEMMDSLRSIGRLASSAGRLLITFFSAGSEAGKSFIDTVTNTFNRWNTWMRSIEGQQSLKTFFAESVQEMANLYHILSPMVKIFARFVKTMRPVSVAFQKITAGALSLLNTLMQIPGVAQLIAVTLTGKMLMGIQGSVRAVVFAFGALRTKLLGASAASAAFSTSLAQLRVAATGVAASSLPGVSKGATVAASGMSRLALAGRGVVGLFGGPVGIALTAATLGFVLFGDKISKAFEGTKSLNEAMVDSQESFRNMVTQGSAATNNAKRYTKEIHSLEGAVKAYNQAVKDGASGEKQATLFENVTKQSNKTQASLDNVKESIISYQREVGKTWNANRDLAESFLKQVDDGGLSAISFGQLRGELERGELTVEGFTQRMIELSNKVDTRGDLTLSSSEIDTLEMLRNFRLGRDLRQLNFDRILTGAERLPDQLGPIFKSVKDGLSSVLSPKQVTSFTDQLAYTSKDTAMKIITLVNALQQLKGPRGFGGKIAAGNIMSGFNLNKPQQTVKALESAFRRLSGSAKLPKLKLDVKKDQFAALQEKLQEMRKIVQGGIKGNVNLTNLSATLTKSRDLAKRLDEIDAANPSVKITISPNWGGEDQWTHEATIIAKRTGGKVAAEGNYIGTASQERSTTRGGRYAAPTFLVGEERRPEFVIATNPAYREQNVGYLMQAAAALNIPGFAAGNAPIIGGGNTKPTRPSKRGAIGNYEWYKKLISWSETETTNTRARMDAQLARGAISQLDYTELISDVTRTEGYYVNLNNTIFSLMAKARKKAKDGADKSKKKPKKGDYPPTDDGQKQFDRDMRFWEKNQQKEKDNKQKLRDYYQERLDIGQALDALETQKMELENERDTGGPLGVTPDISNAMSLLAGGYALQQQFGSSVITGSASIGGGGSFINPGGTLPAAPPTINDASVTGRSAVGGRGAVPAGGKVVTITNNYQEPPTDPHTWSKNLAWEVGVA